MVVSFYNDNILHLDYDIGRMEVFRMGNSDLQIFRWGIPGWITVFTYSILVLSLNNFDIYTYTNKNNLNGANMAGMAALFVAAGVPLGYLVYQIYFGFKWTFMKKDKITTTLKGVNLYDGYRFLAQNPWEDWQHAERSFDSYLTVLLSKEKMNYEDIIRRYNSFKSRTDRVHGMGATIWGIALSFITFIIIHIFLFQIPVYKNITFLVTSVVLIFVWLIILRNYRESNDATFVQMKYIMTDIDVHLELIKEENKVKSTSS